LLRFEGFAEGPGSQGQGEGLVHLRGEVRNESSETLEDVEVVITVYNKDDAPVAANRERVLNWEMHPRETSTFSISFKDYVNAAAYTIAFEMPAPGILELKTEHGVRTRLRRSQLSQS
jgi:hypothetical protein